MTERELIQEVPIFEDIFIEELTEGEDNSLKLLTIKGTASRGDMFNKNNRMYPTKVLKKVAEKLQPTLKSGKFTGQLDHPGWFDDGGLQKTAIKFTKLWMDGDDLRFEGNVIPTTPGKELEVLLRAGVGIGMSTRGYGTVLPYKNKNGKEDAKRTVIQDDFELVGVDAVLNESNKYGKVSQFEQMKGGHKVELTLEQLKTDYPELVEELSGELTTSINADFDTKVKAEVDKQVADQTEALKDSIKAEMSESQDVKDAKDFINKLVESIKPFIPGQEEYVNTEKQKEIDALTDQLAQATETAKTTQTELDALKEEKDAAEAQQKVADHVASKVEGHRFSAQLKDRLSKCTTVEDVDATFDAEVSYIESLVKAVDPKGEGFAEGNKDDDATSTKGDTEKERQRKLAGIKTEGGN
jgi:hypothetical protein